MTNPMGQSRVSPIKLLVRAQKLQSIKVEWPWIRPILVGAIFQSSITDVSPAASTDIEYHGDRLTIASQPFRITGHDRDGSRAIDWFRVFVTV